MPGTEQRARRGCDSQVQADPASPFPPITWPVAQSIDARRPVVTGRSRRVVVELGAAVRRGEHHPPHRDGVTGGERVRWSMTW
jgi:hypothetical protein